MSLTPLAAFNDDHEQYGVEDQIDDMRREYGGLKQAFEDRLRRELRRENRQEQAAQAAALREWE
jgi:hypothetical protein